MPALRRQGDVEGGLDAGGGVAGDVSAVGFDGALDDGQAEAASLLIPDFSSLLIFQRFR